MIYDPWACRACGYTQPQPGPASRHGGASLFTGDQIVWCPGSGQPTVANRKEMP
jgi:hypothetical protein